MKKKLLAIVFAVMLALGCFVGLVACGSNVEGTYYAYENGNKVEGVSMILEDGKVTVVMSALGLETKTEAGTYEVDGKKVVVTATVGGVSTSEEMEIVSSGVLKVGDGMYYCKEGKTPPEETTEE